MRALIFAVGFMLMSMLSDNLTIVYAQDTLTPEQRGRGKAQLCTRCHGRVGLARAAKAQGWEGSVEGFIVLGLSQFRDGTRLHAVMNSVAGPMTDVDIEDVAAWYEKVSGFKETN